MITLLGLLTEENVLHRTGDFEQESQHYNDFYTIDPFWTTMSWSILQPVQLFSSKPPWCYFSGRHKHRQSVSWWREYSLVHQMFSTAYAPFLHNITA